MISTQQAAADTDPKEKPCVMPCPVTPSDTGHLSPHSAIQTMPSRASWAPSHLPPLRKLRMHQAYSKPAVLSQIQWLYQHNWYFSFLNSFKKSEFISKIHFHGSMAFVTREYLVSLSKSPLTSWIVSRHHMNYNQWMYFFLITISKASNTLGT